MGALRDRRFHYCGVTPCAYVAPFRTLAPTRLMPLQPRVRPNTRTFRVLFRNLEDEAHHWTNEASHQALQESAFNWRTPLYADERSARSNSNEAVRDLRLESQLAWFRYWCTTKLPIGSLSGHHEHYDKLEVCWTRRLSNKQIGAGPAIRPSFSC